MATNWIEESIVLRALVSSDVPMMVEAFAEVSWEGKTTAVFNRYLYEQAEGERVVWLALFKGQFAGYVTLKWKSLYQPFAVHAIPEIMDLNVLPAFRNHGIASSLLTAAEQEAVVQSNTIGIGVGLYGGVDGGYGAAQRLYVKRGYVPDGQGVTYHYKPAAPGANYPLDDELVLWFSKNLR